jgi:hypothetical protein
VTPADRLRALALNLRAEASQMQRRPRDRMNGYADEALEVAVLLEAAEPAALRVTVPEDFPAPSPVPTAPRGPAHQWGPWGPDGRQGD